MPDWYRNIEWSADIATEFEARLARARGQRAQYLVLQGYALLAGHPQEAEGLLQRAVAMNDAFHTTRALAFLAMARLALNDVDGALDAFEQGLAAQVEQPNMVAVQPADYAFVVGYFRREDRVPAAQAIAEALPDDGIFGPDPQILAAKAMIFDLAGQPEAARSAAAKALPLMDDFGEAVALGVDLGDLRRRMAALAGSDS